MFRLSTKDVMSVWKRGDVTPRFTSSSEGLNVAIIEKSRNNCKRLLSPDAQITIYAL
jgi:hypothetical protein